MGRIAEARPGLSLAALQHRDARARARSFRGGHALAPRGAQGRAAGARGDGRAMGGGVRETGGRRRRPVARGARCLSAERALRPELRASPLAKESLPRSARRHRTARELRQVRDIEHRGGGRGVPRPARQGPDALHPIARARTQPAAGPRRAGFSAALTSRGRAAPPKPSRDVKNLQDGVRRVVPTTGQAGNASENPANRIRPLAVTATGSSRPSSGSLRPFVRGMCIPFATFGLRSERA